MIKLVHQHSEKIVAIYKDGKQIEGYADEVVITAFWAIASDYPDQWICWIEEQSFEFPGSSHLDCCNLLTKL